MRDEDFDGASLRAELGQTVRSVTWRRPSLNEVFLWTLGPGLDGGES